MKALCDRAVKYEKDITEVDDMIKAVNTQLEKVKLFAITEKDIEFHDKMIPADLKAIPQTKKIVN